jgi:hypothetical protein
MLKLEKTDVFGWESAIRGMRNPMNSWDKSDSKWCNQVCLDCPENDEGYCESEHKHDFVIGENDLKLMKSLSKAGSDHAKFLRMINVTVDITAPLYWWKEFDTYKVGTVANSCSTMHKIHAKEFTLDDFSYEHLTLEARDFLETTVDYLNYCRNKFLDTKDKIWWWQMIQLLPSSYNQKRTVQMNYQVLTPMYFARRHHKLDCWHTLCDWMLELPYFRDISIQE